MLAENHVVQILKDQRKMPILLGSFVAVRYFKPLRAQTNKSSKQHFFALDVFDTQKITWAVLLSFLYGYRSLVI